MRKFVSFCLLLTLSSTSAYAATIPPQVALQMVSEQQGQDPIIGVWRCSAGGYRWETAIIRTPDGYTEDMQLVGVLLKPWPNFGKGEIHLRLTNPGSDGTYYGQEKWKNLPFGGSWERVTVRLLDSTHLLQSNKIHFSTPLGSKWVLTRVSPVAEPLKPTAPLRQTGSGNLNTATIVGNNAQESITSDVMFWFDEDPPVAGQRVLQVVVTARAYEGVLNVLRQVRGSNTQVRGGFSILETNYHPPTFQLGEWLTQNSSPDSIGSVFYWEDEVLSDTTPVMSFYMTPGAYRGAMDAVSQSLAQPSQSANLSPSQKQKRHSFLQGLGIIVQGALEGAANYYAVVRPVEQAQLAAQQAQATQNYYGSQQVYQLQTLNQTLDQIKTQAFLDQLKNQTDQYNRLLERYKTGYWPR